MRTILGVDVFCEVTHGDDGASLVAEILHVFFEVLEIGVDPRMLDGGDAMKAENCDLSVLGLIDRPHKILHFPVGAGVAGGGDEQGIVDLGIVSGTARPASPVPVFGTDTAPGEEEAVLLQHANRSEIVSESREAKGHRFGDPVVGTTLVDVGEGGEEFFLIQARDVSVVLGVVPDLISHVVELTDLFPGNVVVRILEEAESLRDVKGGTEAVLLEYFRDVGEVGNIAVVEAENDQFVRDGKIFRFRFLFRLLTSR